MTNRARAALWDMDGTLIDSGEDHWDAWMEVFSENGFTMTRDDFNGLFGRRNVDAYKSNLGTCPPEHLPRISDAKEERYRQNILKRGTAMIPGAAALVKQLHADGWKQALGTAAPRANAEAVLQAIGLADYFDLIVASEDVTAGKPDPM